MPAVPQIFISYSRKDIKWRAELERHLKPFVRNNRLTIWTDTKLEPGTKWEKEIIQALRDSAGGILLVTDFFLESEFIIQTELPEILRKKVYWVALDHCSFEETVISDYTCLNDPKKPLKGFSPTNRNKQWVEICKKIVQSLDASTSTSDRLEVRYPNTSLEMENEERISVTLIVEAPHRNVKNRWIAEIEEALREHIGDYTLVVDEFREKSNEIVVEASTTGFGRLKELYDAQQLEIVFGYKVDSPQLKRLPISSARLGKREEESDEELLEKLLIGDERAKGILFERNIYRVTGMLRRIMPTNDYEEKASEVLLDVLTKLPNAWLNDQSRNNVSKFRFLLQLIKNYISVSAYSDRTTSSSQQIASLTEEMLGNIPAEPQTNPEDIVVERLSMEQVLREVASTTSPTSFKAFTMFHLQGFSFKEIADYFGIPEYILMIRIHRVKIAIKRRLQELEFYIPQTESGK